VGTSSRLLLLAEATSIGTFSGRGPGNETDTFNRHGRYIVTDVTENCPSANSKSELSVYRFDDIDEIREGGEGRGIISHSESPLFVQCWEPEKYPL